MAHLEDVKEDIDLIAVWGVIEETLGTVGRVEGSLW